MEPMMWRKSSRSSGNGGACVEVAAVPDTWRKSSRSSANGGDCVEVAAAPGTVWIRDSKDPGGPMLRLPAPAFRTFVEAARDDRLTPR